MTIDEAIYYLEQEQEFRHFLEIEPLGQALKLGIEALKNVKSRRKGVYIVKKYRLPGETGE